MVVGVAHSAVAAYAAFRIVRPVEFAAVLLRQVALCLAVRVRFERVAAATRQITINELIEKETFNLFPV